MTEYLDIVNENGEPTGERVERSFAHANGVRHRTSHVWILRMKNGRTEILLQMRSKDKDSFPGCYDISSAGHIPAGDDYAESALRELEEELGVTVGEDELHECGVRRFRFESVFHGKPFIDHQVTKVYCLWLDMEENEFVVQRSEIDYVRWFGFEECVQAVREQTIPSAIFPEELEMIRQFIEKNKKNRG